MTVKLSGKTCKYDSEKCLKSGSPRLLGVQRVLQYRYFPNDSFTSFSLTRIHKHREEFGLTINSCRYAGEGLKKKSEKSRVRKNAQRECTTNATDVFSATAGNSEKFLSLFPPMTTCNTFIRSNLPKIPLYGLCGSEQA